REFRRCWIVSRPLVAVEAMICSVNEHLHLRVGLGELPHAGDGYGLIALAEMREHRAARTLAHRIEHAAAVIRHGAGEPLQTASAHPGDETAPAIADHANLSG